MVEVRREQDRRVLELMMIARERCLDLNLLAGVGVCLWGVKGDQMQYQPHLDVRWVDSVVQLRWMLVSVSLGPW